VKEMIQEKTYISSITNSGTKISRLNFLHLLKEGIIKEAKIGSSAYPGTLFRPFSSVSDLLNGDMIICGFFGREVYWCDVDETNPSGILWTEKRDKIF